METFYTSSGLEIRVLRGKDITIGSESNFVVSGPISKLTVSGRQVGFYAEHGRIGSVFMENAAKAAELAAAFDADILEC